MDPSRTLVTFLFQTHPSVASAHLIGSWDNFSARYAMEPDVRRGRGMWKGCYSFRGVSPDNAAAAGRKRNGGLKMGQTYYYYYEVDGHVETHDPHVPSTSACPYLPGQTVNIMHVPEEKSLRQRSASLNSLRQFNFRTQNPESKFITPKPQPTHYFDFGHIPHNVRHGSAPGALQQQASSRSQSPAPVWRRIFARKLSNGSHASREGERGPAQEHDAQSIQSIEATSQVVEVDDGVRSRCLTPAGSIRSRSRTPSEGIRTREISPESLRRFLVDDTPLRPDSNMSERPALVIPEDIAEENEDDDNFATSALSETVNFSTCLSPPPAHKRTVSSESMQRAHSVSAVPAVPTIHERRPSEPALLSRATVNPFMSQPIPRLAVTYEQPASFFSSTATSPASPMEPNTFYDSGDDDDDDREDDLALADIADISPGTACPPTFEGYSLPETLAKSNDGLSPPKVNVAFNLGSNGFLTSPIDNGLDDFASEMGWLVDSMGAKPN